MFKKNVFQVLFLLFFLVVVGINQVNGMQEEALKNIQTPQEIAQRAFKSTLLLVMEDSNNQPISLGSGFIISDGQVATNLHVVEGSKNGYARIVGQKINYNIEGYTVVDLEHDLIILRVPGIISSNLSLGNSDSVQVGETVYVAGNPQGLEGTFSHGIVSGIRLVGNDKLLQITAPISPGSSGGPVLNNRGEVIGISFASFSEGQNLNFAIPSNYLKPLINKSQQVIPLAQIKLDKSKKSIVSEIGKQSSEGVVAGQLAWKYSFVSDGSYSFSLQNKLRENVKNIYCFVIFYDSSGNPIDVDSVYYRDIIPAGLAKRVTSWVHESVQKLTTKQGSIEPHTKVEIRVLYFDIIK